MNYIANESAWKTIDFQYKTKINFTKAKVSDGFSGVFFILEKVAYMLRIYLGFWSNEKKS